MALCERTGMHGFYVGVRGGVEDLHLPKVFFSEKAESFVKEVLNMDPGHLALKFEAWVISGMAGLSRIHYMVDLADVMACAKVGGWSVQVGEDGLQVKLLATVGRESK
jgi:hypothetical protein